MVSSFLAIHVCQALLPTFESVSLPFQFLPPYIFLIVALSNGRTEWGGEGFDPGRQRLYRLFIRLVLLGYM